MKYLLLTSLLIMPFISFSQIEIKGIINNNQDEPLSYANITVYDRDTSVLVTYAISDDVGAYNLQLEEGTYVFEVSYLGYASASSEKIITQNETINFTLVEDAASLDEIVVKSKPLDAIVRDDTIRYNLEQLTNGSEENLKDILNKLPGIEIDENGKIKAHGKKIDKLLIDGKEFFGDQHQLGTENISAEMIEGISLLENFEGFSDLDSETQSGKTAMNIEIGEDYKGNVKGNLSLGGGYNEKYEANTNLFSFRKKANLFFIANSNNIGNQVFTFEDYISFQGGIQKLLGDNSGSATLSSGDLPSYLFSNDRVERKNEQFSAFNFSYNPTKKFKLNSYLIFDRVNVAEKELTKQTYLTNTQNVILNLEHTKDNTFNVNNSFINAVYKPSNKSIFDYTLNFSPQQNNLSNGDKFDSRNFNTERNINGYSLNQALSYKQKIGHYILSTTLYNTIKDSDESLHLTSDSRFLNLTFQEDDYSISQEIKSKENNFGLNTSLNRKIGKNVSLKVKHNVSQNNSTFNTNTTNNPFNNDIKLDVLENIFGLSIYSKSKTLLNYEIGANYSVLNANEINLNNVLPYANIKFNFKKAHSLNLSYRRTIKLPQVNNIIEDNYVFNFNTLVNNQNLAVNNIATYDNLILRYFIYDLFSGTLFSLGGNLTIGKDVAATNTVNFTDYRVNHFSLADNGKSANSYLLLDKKFSKIPFSVRLKNTFSFIEKNNFIDNTPNSINSNTLSNSVKISSNFKKSILNFDLGYERRQSNVETNNIDFNSTVILNRPFVNLYVNYKKFNLAINSSFEDYYSGVSNQQFYRIDPSLNYNSKKWSFYLRGNDILNMNRNSIVENEVHEGFFEEKIVSTIGGFALAGLKYKF